MSLVINKLVDYIKQQYNHPKVRVYTYSHYLNRGICVDEYPTYRMQIRIKEMYDPKEAQHIPFFIEALSLSDPNILAKIDRMIVMHKRNELV